MSGNDVKVLHRKQTWYVRLADQRIFLGGSGGYAEFTDKVSDFERDKLVQKARKVEQKKERA